ncbi:MAG TPA: DUF58 domain-containing protein [Methylophilaceae bacterium]|nr:DUF58 domain-containing protein [Methylophilaceae bacterium]
MVPDFAQAFTYQINWRSRSYHAGHHHGLQSGVGIEFRGNVPLVDYPDARRIDVRQTIRDPGDQVHVRIYNQKNVTPIYAVCDLSGSMQFVGRRSKLMLAAEVAASVAYSAYQASDSFSFIGFDRMVREDWLTPPSHRMHDAFELTRRLMHYQPEHAGSEGLLDLSRYLGASRGLVFLISDFHMPLELLEQGINMLSRHHVVPIVLWDPAEYRQLPTFGLSTIIDPETGEQRTLFFRESLRKRFEQAFAERRAALEDLFLRYEIPTHFVEDRFDAAAISEYFHQFSAL